MARIMGRSMGLALLLVLTVSQPAAAQPAGDEPLRLTRTFLDAYARGDREPVLKLVDGDAITVYGSDVAEVFHGRAELAAMLAADQRLWGGSASIGAMEHVTTIAEDGQESIFFDAPFSVGDRPPVTVRFCLVWRHRREGWRLVLSSNVVPTRGQSAAELLHER